MANAALAAALLATPAWAQRRGGVAFGSTGRAGGFAFHGPAMGGPGSVRFGDAGGVRFGSTFRRPVFLPNRFGHGRFFGGYSYYPAYYVYPSYSLYPGFYSDSDDLPSAYTSYVPSEGYLDNNALIQQQQLLDEEAQQREIERLEEEVDRLRAKRENFAQPPAEPEMEPTTQLVFKDGHSEEVQNYAIVGKTLWIFNEQRARRVPLSGLDISATTNANEKSGVDFHLPE